MEHGANCFALRDETHWEIRAGDAKINIAAPIILGYRTASRAHFNFSKLTFN